MKKLLVFIMLVPALLFAQEKNCGWRPGTDHVCDSIAKRCSETAYAMTQRACGMKTSLYYDSLYCSEGYLVEFDFALRSFYNDLADSLGDFRPYLGYFPGITKDSDTIITLQISHAGRQKGMETFTMTGNKQIDSLCTLWKFKYLSKQANGLNPTVVKFSCPEMINRSYIYRHLHKYDPMVMVSGYYPPSPYDMIQVTIDDLSGDLITIAVCETSACMPPELPCSYIRRTFYAQREWSCRYVKFERGVIPWMEDELLED